MRTYPKPTQTEHHISHWVNHKANKHCTVHSVKLDNGDWRTTITGYNPLPCKAFEGSFYVLADWLKNNGWEFDFSKAKVIIIEKNGNQ